MFINGVSGSLGVSRHMRGLRGPGSNVMSPNEQTNAMIQNRIAHTVRFLHDAEQNSGRLLQALAGLPGAFTPRTAVSSNTDALRINSFNAPSSGQALPETNVNIIQLATSQRNEGVGLNREELFVGHGTFEFEIEIDGETRRIEFAVNESEVLTNLQFQQRMVNAINNANIGLTANTITVGSHTALSITTRTTGAGEEGQPRFTITDIRGNAADLTGIDNIVQEGQNALFVINEGEEQSSASNDVNIGGGINVTFLQASTVSISLGQDRIHMQNAARNLVNQFNAMLDTAVENSVDRNTRALARQIEGASRMSRRALAEIGINVNRDGSLSIDANRMSSAADSGALERFLTGGNNSPNSFIGRIERIADNVARNPLRHLSPHATRMPGFQLAWANFQNSLNNPQPQQGANPFSAYSSNMDDWMSVLFDSSL